MKRRYWALFTMIFIAVGVVVFTLKPEDPVVKKKNELSKKYRDELVRIVKRRLKKKKTPVLSFDKKDEFLEGLTSILDKNKSFAIFEFEQFKESYNGERIIECAFDAKRRNEMAGSRDIIGIDLFNDIKRIAILPDKSMLIDGDFETSHFDEFAESPQIVKEKYSEDSSIYLGRKWQLQGRTMVLHKKNTLYLGASDNGQKFLETVEGERSVTDQWDYDESGDLYGEVTVKEFFNIFNPKNMINGDVRHALVAAVDKIKFNFDLSQGGALHIDLEAKRSIMMDLFGKMIDIAFAAFKLSVTSLADKDDELKNFIEHTDFQSFETENGLHLIISVPQYFLDDVLDECLEKQEDLDYEGGR